MQPLSDVIQREINLMPRLEKLWKSGWKTRVFGEGGRFWVTTDAISEGKPDWIPISLKALEALVEVAVEMMAVAEQLTFDWSMRKPTGAAFIEVEKIDRRA